MYVRPQSYPASAGVRLPKNYGGSTFRENVEALCEDSTEHSGSAQEPMGAVPALKDECSACKNEEPPAGASLFGQNGIGSEELLLLALILLLSQSDIGDELILLLVLLLFVK